MSLFFKVRDTQPVMCHRHSLLTTKYQREASSHCPETSRGGLVAGASQEVDEEETGCYWRSCLIFQMFLHLNGGSDSNSMGL